MSPRWSTRVIDTAVGPARVHRAPRRTGVNLPFLLLGHGAGGGIESADLQVVARTCAAAGVGVLLIEQPWRVAGRRVAPRPAVLDAAWRDVVRGLRLHRPIVVGGRSAGARVAARTAEQVGAIGVVALAFPLHPPGRPDRSRADELRGVRVPLLVVQGSSDPFGSPAEIRRAAPHVSVQEAVHGDHALAGVNLESLGAWVLDFVRSLAPGGVP